MYPLRCPSHLNPAANMLFNSYSFLFFFLPVAFAGYFLLNGKHLTKLSRLWLVSCSLFFYGWWDPGYLPLILLSIVANFALGTVIGIATEHKRKLLATGICLNVALLCYYKYTGFIVDNVNALLGADIQIAPIVLPLAISFFTFQQIAYLVDSARGETREYDFLNYALFVTFFPQLIAGPIVHHAEMMPQFRKLRNLVVDHANILQGLGLFTLGLAKKVLLADTFAIWANAGFAAPQGIGFAQAWTASLSYTLQLYFDFSGYMDMATGAALLFNIRLPRNFDSPYKSASLQDFWRRWHITLGRFLRSYVYIPLGGSRRGTPRLLGNLFATFLIGGIWHGAGWTFAIWGALHGLGLVVHRLWTMTGRRLPPLAARALTFLFVHCAWVVFRAQSADDALHVLSAMFLKAPSPAGLTLLPLAAILAGLAIVWGLPNAREAVENNKSSSLGATVALAGLACASLIALEIRNASEFLYFQF